MLFSSLLPSSTQKVYICIHYHWANSSSVWIFSSSYLKSKPQIFPFTSNNVTANSIAPKHKQLNGGKPGLAKLPHTVTGPQWRLGATAAGETPWQKPVPNGSAAQGKPSPLSADRRHITKQEYTTTRSHV